MIKYFYLGMAMKLFREPTEEEMVAFRNFARAVRESVITVMALIMGLSICIAVMGSLDLIVSGKDYSPRMLGLTWLVSLASVWIFSRAHYTHRK